MISDARFRFLVAGVPATKGSTRAVAVKRRDGRIGTKVLPDCDRLKAWQEDVGWAARLAGLKGPAWPGAVALYAEFILPKPKSGPGSVLIRPDGDKLIRAVMDALTGIAYLDDAQVISGSWKKRLSSPSEGPGALVTVFHLRPAP